jgi:hypothetical protein
MRDLVRNVLSISCKFDARFMQDLCEIHARFMRDLCEMYQRAQLGSFPKKKEVAQQHKALPQ